jgi:hypothetical protein
MKWITFDADCIESEDARYSITRARMGGGKERFTTWYRGVKPSQDIGCSDTAERARELAELHERGDLLTTELAYAPQPVTR